jgi:D-alanine-D-alanine ligase
MTPTSLAPEQAQHCGISFPQLMARLIDSAALDGE